MCFLRSNRRSTAAFTISENRKHWISRRDEYIPATARSPFIQQGRCEVNISPRQHFLLKLPPSLYKCLATTNVIESPQSGVARRTADVTRCRDREMVERWVASAWLLKEKNFRKIDGHRDLWALATILGRRPLVQPIREK